MSASAALSTSRHESVEADAADWSGTHDAVRVLDFFYLGQIGVRTHRRVQLGEVAVQSTRRHDQQRRHGAANGPEGVRLAEPTFMNVCGETSAGKPD